jgi:hypothetical protein
MKRDDYLLTLQRAARSHVLAVNPTLEEDKQREWLHNVHIDRVTCADFLRKACQVQDSNTKALPKGSCAIMTLSDFRSG